MRHTDRQYEAELQELKERLLIMAGLVEEMITMSVQALVERDGELARQVMEMEQEVNDAETETDRLCLIILAKRQPLGSDLRFITLALKMVTDLERIGDLAVNVSERALRLLGVYHIPAIDDIQAMTTRVQAMVRDAINAFVNRDVELAQKVIQRDDEVDEAYHRIIGDMIPRMRQQPDFLETGIHIQSVSKFLERMADHSTNLAELVIFMVNGQDIRHAGKRGVKTDGV